MLPTVLTMAIFDKRRRALPLVDGEEQGLAHAHVVERLLLVIGGHHVAAVPVALLHRDLVAELLHQLIARRGRQRPEFQGRAVGADGVGAHRLFGREDGHEAVEVGLARVIVVGIALALDGLADLVLGHLERTGPHDVLLVPVHVLVELRLRINVAVGIGQRRQERQGGKLQLEHHRLVVRRGDGVDHHEVILARAGDAGLGMDDLVPARGNVLCRQGRAVVKLHALADLEGVGQPVVRRLRHLGAQVAHEIGGRGRIARIDADQDAVERRRRVHHRVGGFAMPIEAGPTVGRDHVGQDAAALGRLCRGRRRAESEDGSQHRLQTRVGDAL